MYLVKDPSGFGVLPRIPPGFTGFECMCNCFGKKMTEFKNTVTISMVTFVSQTNALRCGFPQLKK